jgi:tetratricopeptide (TPR) repeat protein
MLIVAGLWFSRRWIGRGPLTAVLFFAGTLLPALGFVNVYPMRYSFVADHFQYLASIGMIVLMVAILHRIVTTSIPARWATASRRIIAVLLLTPLAWITWQQQHIYKDRLTLWQNTIAQNPACWMAHVNLASALRENKQPDAAMAQSLLALQLAPNEADTNYDVGAAYAQRLQWKDAIAMFHRAIDCDQQCSFAWNSLARVLWEHGQTPQDQADAVSDAEKALQIREGLADSDYVLARYAELRGDLPTAIADYEKALLLNDKDYYSNYYLGTCLQATNRVGEAAGEYQRALAINPRYTPALTSLGMAYLQVDRPGDAVDCFQKALQLEPTLRPAQDGLIQARKMLGRDQTEPRTK